MDAEEWRNRHEHREGSDAERQGSEQAFNSKDGLKNSARKVFDRFARRNGPASGMTAQEWTDLTMQEEYPQRRPDGSYRQKPEDLRRRCNELRTDDGEFIWILLPDHEQTGKNPKYITHKYLVDHGRENADAGLASRYIGSMLFRDGTTYEQVMGLRPPLRVVPPLDQFADVRARLKKKS